MKTILKDFEQWHSISASMSSILLAIVSIGLICAYIILVLNIKKYFKE